MFFHFLHTHLHTQVHTHLIFWGKVDEIGRASLYLLNVLRIRFEEGLIVQQNRVILVLPYSAFAISAWIRPNAKKQLHTPTYGHLQCVTHRPRRVVFGNSRDVLQWGLYFRLVSAALNYKGHKKSGRFAALSYSEIIVNCTFRSSAHFLDQSCNLFVYMLLHPQTLLPSFVLFVFPPLSTTHAPSLEWPCHNARATNARSTSEWSDHKRPPRNQTISTYFTSKTVPFHENGTVFAYHGGEPTTHSTMKLTELTYTEWSERSAALSPASPSASPSASSTPVLERPVVIDFYVPWCNPCKAFRPLLEEAAERYAGQVDFYQVDIDRERRMAVLFRVRNVPALALVSTDGSYRIVAGAMPPAELHEAVEKLLHASTTPTSES